MGVVAQMSSMFKFQQMALEGLTKLGLQAEQAQRQREETPRPSFLNRIDLPPRTADGSKVRVCPQHRP